MTDDTDNYPRAYPLTPEQLRRAYAWDDRTERFFATLAATRLAMLPQETDREPPVEENE
jgi:hypothetical protein